MQLYDLIIYIIVFFCMNIWINILFG